MTATTRTGGTPQERLGDTGVPIARSGDPARTNRSDRCENLYGIVEADQRFLTLGGGVDPDVLSPSLRQQLCPPRGRAAHHGTRDHGCGGKDENAGRGAAGLGSVAAHA